MSKMRVIEQSEASAGLHRARLPVADPAVSRGVCIASSVRLDDKASGMGMGRAICRPFSRRTESPVGGPERSVRRRDPVRSAGAPASGERARMSKNRQIQQGATSD